MAVEGTGVPPKTSRLEKSVCVFSFDVGPRSLETGALEVVEFRREVMPIGDALAAIGTTRSCEDAAKRRLELATARLKGASCIGGIMISVVLY